MGLSLLVMVFGTVEGAIPVMKFDEFQSKVLQKQSDTLYVINFWATWCKPCIQELPYFEELENNYKGKKVKVILVSLDFKTNLEDKVIPFVEKREIKSDVILLDDLDYNSWIDQVSTDWSGAIPATLFLNPEKGISTFREGEFDRESLNKQISQYL